MVLREDKNLEADLYFETGTAQINKYGEELCGDTISVENYPEWATAILSDGLGSGVKANILSTLTTKILKVMLNNDCAMQEAVETLVKTLPTCQVRQLAYSTFSLAHLDQQRNLQIVNYDNPEPVFIRDDRVKKIDFEQHIISGKEINEKKFKVKNGDILVLMSDGELHAGIFNSVNLDWDWERIADFVRRLSLKPLTAQEISNELINVASRMYADKPGDDTSVVVVKVRTKQYATIMMGAPLNKEDDVRVVEKFMNQRGRKIICGGTTGNIVARELNLETEVDLKTLTDGIPPVGKMKGIDLCTEGIITISNALKLLEEMTNYKNLELHNNGASMLVREMLKADDILFMVGQSINPAHQTANMPKEFGLKTQISKRFTEILTSMGKHIEIEFY